MTRLNFKEKAASFLTALGFLTVVGLNPSDDSQTWESDFILSKLMGLALILIGIAVVRYSKSQNHASE